MEKRKEGNILWVSFEVMKSSLENAKR